MRVERGVKASGLGHNMTLTDWRAFFAAASLCIFHVFLVEEGWGR